MEEDLVPASLPSDDDDGHVFIGHERSPMPPQNCGPVILPSDDDDGPPCLKKPARKKWALKKNNPLMKKRNNPTKRIRYPGIGLKDAIQSTFGLVLEYEPSLCQRLPEHMLRFCQDDVAEVCNPPRVVQMAVTQFAMCGSCLQTCSMGMTCEFLINKTKLSNQQGPNHFKSTRP